MLTFIKNAVKRESGRTTAAHRYCEDDETLLCHWIIYLGRQGSKMNPSQETCLIFVDSFGGKDIYKGMLSVIGNVYHECRWALSGAHFFMQFLLNLLIM